MITLSSDFGSPYPAAMKGVILARSDARMIDIAHDFPRHDVRTTAFWLRAIVPYFPPAVHLVVIDPGVGTDRAGIVVRSGDHGFVGPDNGVLIPAARRLSGGSPVEVFAIDDDHFSVERHTFHGRDIFAPTAAEVHESGVDDLEALQFLEPADDVVDLTFPEPDVSPTGATGEVLVVDDFGNVITNVPGDIVDGIESASVRVDGESVPLRRSYGGVDQGARLVTVGSHGNVELAVNQGRGDVAFDSFVGDRIRLSWEADEPPD